MTDSQPMTMLDAFLPQRRALHQAALILGASLAIGLLSQVAIPLPMTPVPLTLQTFAVLLTGLTLGRKLGTAAVLAWLAEGAIGLPVFAGGVGGAAWLLGPTGGYLIGFAFAAALVGWLAERHWDRRPLTAALAMALGSAVIYAFGVVGLLRFEPLSLAVMQGVVPFLPGDLIKIAVATLGLPGGWAMLRR